MNTKIFLLLFFVIIFSCEPDRISNYDPLKIQDQISEDEDFFNLVLLGDEISGVFAQGKTLDKEISTYETSIREKFDILNARYRNFDANAKVAIESEKFHSYFTNYIQGNSLLAKEGIFEGVCGFMSGPCATGGASVTVVKGCLSGCDYAVAACIEQGGATPFCSSISTSCRSSCCAQCVTIPN